MHDVRTAFIASIGTLLCLFFLGTTSVPVVSSDTQLLRTTFLDVGQGDAILIESPTGTQVLIDGGRGNAVLGALEEVMGYFDTDIDMVVATHPDADHIGGLIEVLKRYSVGSILMTENESDTALYETFMGAVYAEGAKIIYARDTQVFTLGEGEGGEISLSVLFPEDSPANLESNESSIVMQMQYGEIGYLFTGDSPKSVEEQLVVLKKDVLESEVLKAGHHGSKTSTSPLFVEAVAPQYAIISAGKDNSYGHPHEGVIETLTESGAVIKSTAKEGSIYSVSNGKTVWFE